MSTSIIEIISLTKSYGSSRGIIDVTFDIKEGEIFGFIGPNGAGKSTTIRTLLALIHPTKGSARIFGMDCIKDSAKIKQNIGYLPSEVNYYDDMKVGELLQYSGSFYRKDCKKRIQELSETFELDLTRPIDDLSYGNKKKVAIVQALLHEPRLLILDEPTGGLDPLMQNKFFEVLKEENNKGVTIFFSSHILSEVQKMCHRVAIIKEGKILKLEQMDKLVANRYKKVKIDFGSNDSGNSLTMPGMVNVRPEGKAVEFLFSGKIDALIQSLSNRKVENLWIEEPSLDEIFMHYYEKEGK